VAVDEAEASLARNTAAPTRSSTSPAARRRAVDQPVAELGVVDQRLGQLGLEVAGPEAIDLNAVLAPVDRHALGEHLHRALAGGVGRDVRPAQLALHRTDVDDLAAPARDHPARDRLADDEDAVDVGAHQLVPVGLGELVERRASLHTGVVDEDVDRADLTLDPLHRIAVASAEVTSKAMA
jgi:hypothetical protein